jgi:hypothetical protein
LNGQRIGYVRVSSFDQNPERQLEHLQVDKVFTDKASGKDTQRPQIDALLAFVREGDTVVVHSMDRLARNLDDLRRLVQDLTQRGVCIEFVKEHLTFTGEDSPMANLMLSVMGAFAEFERALIRERQRDLRDLEPFRRYATLVAVILDTRATLIDEIIDLHDRFMGSLFSKAKRHHADRFQESGKAINDKVRLYSRIGRALVEAKQSGGDPFAAIEAVIPWEVFTETIAEAERLAQPEEFDYLARVGDGFNQLRRYTPILLDTLNLKAAPAARDLLEAVEVLRDMNSRRARKAPDDAPTLFVRKRWEHLVRTPDGLDRRYYELCVLSELKNSLRSGDIWVPGSRQFKDFEDYLLPPPRFAAQRDQKELGLAVETDCERYLESQLAVLQEQLATVERLAAAKELPESVRSTMRRRTRRKRCCSRRTACCHTSRLPNCCWKSMAGPASPATSSILKVARRLRTSICC